MALKVVTAVQILLIQLLITDGITLPYQKVDEVDSLMKTPIRVSLERNRGLATLGKLLSQNFFTQVFFYNKAAGARKHILSRGNGLPNTYSKKKISKIAFGIPFVSPQWSVERRSRGMLNDDVKSPLPTSKECESDRPIPPMLYYLEKTGFEQ